MLFPCGIANKHLCLFKNDQERDWGSKRTRKKERRVKKAIIRRQSLIVLLPLPVYNPCFAFINNG